jgi:hypothetical protein
MIAIVHALEKGLNLWRYRSYRIRRGRGYLPIPTCVIARFYRTMIPSNAIRSAHSNVTQVYGDTD